MDGFQLPEGLGQCRFTPLNKQLQVRYGCVECLYVHVDKHLIEVGQTCDVE